MKASQKSQPDGRQAKISVIMAAYNGMPYLTEAVKSILNQTYQNFEFIIVDDSSTDTSWKYLKSLKDVRIILLKNKKNLGLAASLNKALKSASGKYIARMDSDDISLPKRLKIQLEYLENNPKISICGSWAKLIDEKGQEIGAIRKPLDDKNIKIMNKLITGIIHPTWFARKGLFKELNGYDKRWDMVEDYEFLIRAQNFKMANIAQELLLWRSPKNRRSQKWIETMYRRSLSVKWKYFRQGTFGISYLPYLFRAVLATYLFPSKLKIFLNKKMGLL